MPAAACLLCCRCGPAGADLKHAVNAWLFLLLPSRCVAFIVVFSYDHVDTMLERHAVDYDGDIWCLLLLLLRW